MTPEEYALTIEYIYFESKFGRMMAASKQKGICNLVFVDDDGTLALSELKSKHSNAT